MHGYEINGSIVFMQVLGVVSLIHTIMTSIEAKHGC